MVLIDPPHIHCQLLLVAHLFDCIGPFVMNTADQIRQAIEDYSLGKNGFERAPGWQSEIGKRR